MRSARIESGLSPEGDALVAYRSPLSVRLDTPDELSFQGWTAQDPLPDFDDEVSSFALEPPEDFQDCGAWLTSQLSDLSFPVRLPDHPSFGKASAVSVPMRAMPGQSPPAIFPVPGESTSIFPTYDVVDQSQAVIADNDDSSPFSNDKIVNMHCHFGKF
jgi:hypothetical protein